MILKTKEERIEFLSGLEFDTKYSFYMINQDELEDDNARIENILVGWAWGYYDNRTSCSKEDLSFLEGDGYGNPYERGSYNYVHIQGEDAYKYVLNYIWADNKLELQKETRRYKKAFEVRNSVLEKLSQY